VYNEKRDISRVLLKVPRFRQHPGECAIAAASTMAAFYDDSITYKCTRELLTPAQRKKGLWTSQQARLLNQLGYGKVTIVTADLLLVDYSWVGLNKEELIEKLKKLRAYYGRKRDTDSKVWVSDFLVWLEDEFCDNHLVISQDFPYYIKRDLNNGRPVGASFNWTSMHKFTKSKEKKKSNGDIGGESEEHAVVIRGYDKCGVFIVDSHFQYYKGKRAKFRNGYYKVSWERFLVNAPYGDLLLVG